MFIVNWFWDALSALGLSNKDAKIVMLGLDNAGKTTLLHMLRDNKLEVHQPTMYACVEEIVMAGINFQTFDCGGHAAARRLWKDYGDRADAIVYLIDAADSDRFEESVAELHALLNTDTLSKKPVLILGNKMDMPTCVSETELRTTFNLNNTTGQLSVAEKGERPIEIFMCSIKERIGFAEGFQWLSKHI